jgi:hypothetical protein
MTAYGMVLAGRSFENELGNRINIEIVRLEGFGRCVEIVGPNSKIECELTAVEMHELRSALADAAVAEKVLTA